MAKTEQNGPTHEDISRRAFEIFEKSGRAPGRDMENWLAAESQLRGAAQSRQQTQSQFPKSQPQAQPAKGQTQVAAGGSAQPGQSQFPKSQPQSQPAKGQTQVAAGSAQPTQGQPKQAEPNLAQPKTAGKTTARPPARSSTPAARI